MVSPLSFQTSAVDLYSVTEFHLFPVQPGLSQSLTESQMQTSWCCSLGNYPFLDTLTSKSQPLQKPELQSLPAQSRKSTSRLKARTITGRHWAHLMRSSSAMLIFQCLRRVVSYIVQFCSCFQWTASLVSLY